MSAQPPGTLPPGALPPNAPPAEAWQLLGGPPTDLDRLHITGPGDTLPSALPVTSLGAAAVGTSLLAATLGTRTPVGLDTHGLAVALRSERYLRRDGHPAGSPFDPLSAFHRTADGWLRLHANYPWHRAAALRVLGCADEPDDVRAAVARWPAVDLETALHDAGGVGAAVRTERQWQATGAPDLPLVERRDLAPAPPRPHRRLRVLDLTRVIAGPVATRTLAAHGADVLRLDNSDRPEIPLQAWDTLPGKHSALLDLGANRDQLEHLLTGADVVVSGYRPGALDRFGLAPESLAQRHPGLVTVTLSAWGHLGVWAPRRGFDSLVQAACGIAVIEGSADAPGALPAQVLDHATGYLAAAAALLAVAEQRRAGGTPHVRLSLLGTAQWLLRLSRAAPGPPAHSRPVAATDPDGDPQPPGSGDRAPSPPLGTGTTPPVPDVNPATRLPDLDPSPYLQELDAPDARLTLAVPPGTIDGAGLRWPAPAPSYGTARAAWQPR